VVVVTTMEEVAPAVLYMLEGISNAWQFFEVKDVRQLEAQEVAVELYGLFHIVCYIEAEVAEPADFERLRQH
jgi:hypothetical protein